MCFLGNHLISKANHKKNVEIVHFDGKTASKKDEIEIPLKEKVSFNKFVATEIDEFFIVLD